jgi:hypothetical protein
MARQCTFAEVKPDFVLLGTGLRHQAVVNLISPGWATVRSHYRPPSISKRTGGCHQLNGCAISYRVNFSKSSSRRRPNARLGACTCAKIRRWLQCRRGSKTITRVSAIRSASPVTKLVSTYSKAVISATATRRSERQMAPPCAAGFESLVRLRQGSGAGDSRLFAQ